jgi:putative nucleotidyltransferase with HDIG domain
MKFVHSLVYSSAGWAFILLIYILVVGLVKVSVYDLSLSQHLVPMLIFPLIIRAFFDLRLAIFIHILNVVLTSSLVTNPFEFIVLQIIAGLVVLFSLRNLRRRSQFFMTALIIFFVYSLIYLNIEIFKVGEIEMVDWKSLRFFAANALITLLAYPLIYLFEKIFGFLSDLTLIEMTDMSNKLLRDLAEKAPGTFQHSLQVANLAEAAIHEIGGHELLVRVGALYHDIGKMKNPMFFIENQVHGINPHDELSYDESSQIIIQHVLDGISLAKKANLPDQIIDFIRTHHGSTRVEYFYRSYKIENPDSEVDESMFSYPGPKPYSKETAVLMMADGVEAASRSMKSYNSESIENLVHSIVNSLMEKDQFSNANVTFRDISVVKKIFIKMLINVYHVRIEYPHAS